MTGRNQYVELEGFKSNEHVITHGVPQGSILGPILFLTIYPLLQISC